MAKSPKSHKSKKVRAKTTLPPVKESHKQHGSKNQRSASIPPSVQQKAHRKRTLVKNSTNSTEKLSTAKQNLKPTSTAHGTSYNNSLTDAFSNLSLNDKKSTNPRQIRNYSSDNNDKRPTGKTRSIANSAKFSSLQDVARLINSGRAKNIVVMAGAGISTASGIPDFRTPGTGLYDNLQQYRIPSPTAIFDLDYFHYDPKPFFTLAKELYPSGKYRPCPPHYFVRLLHEKGLLLRMYTQNIDGLERIAGIPPEKLVEAHGTFSTASCTRCGKKYNGEQIKKKILNGAIPRCQSTELCWGIVKPDIVFFGEDLPRRFYYYLKDFPACDLLIIMGTSLEVEPFASLTDSVRSSTPRLLLNRELVGPFSSKSCKRNHDVAVTGDLTDSIRKFARLVGWKEELQMLMETTGKEEEEEKDEKSDATSTDSGLSSPSTESSSETSKKPKPLLPPDNNIKRYFHTLRTTPLPKAKNFTDSQVSYFDYIRDKTVETPNANDRAVVKNIKRTAVRGTTIGDSPITIQYAQTIKQKKRTKVISFGAGNNFSNSSLSSCDSSNDSQSESSGQASSYTTSSSDDST